MSGLYTSRASRSVSMVWSLSVRQPLTRPYDAAGGLDPRASSGNGAS